MHESGRPFDDQSGERLREWMGVTRETFYDASKIAILPMGLCYPGKGSAGDLPPRPECAPAWHSQLLSHLRHLKLTLVIGRYAQDYHLKQTHLSLTQTVLRWRAYGPGIVPLPHPSPRNNIWRSRNPWFEETLVPELRERVASTLAM